MFVDMLINGKKTPVELVAKLINEQGDTRKWELTNANGGPLVDIRFTERSFVLESVEKLTEQISTDQPDYIRNWINDFLKEQLEKRQSGLDISEDNEQAEPQPYDPRKINIRSQNWAVSHVFELIDKWQQVDLAPDFQRGFVWDYARKSRLIESLMLRIPVPAFYLAETEDGKYQVVDGVQRLTTITEFMKNEFPLKHLEYLNDQEGFFFENNEAINQQGIDGNYWRNILQTQITVNIIEAKSPSKVKFDVFRRVNTGGKPLNNQEIRNCLAEKHTRDLINELAFSDQFRSATSGSVGTARMEAQELVLRFIGLWHDRVKRQSEWIYKGNMTEYLDNAVELLNARKPETFDEIRRAFYSSMTNAEHLFEQYSFRKCLPQHLAPGARQQLINKSLYSTWSVVLSRVATEEVASVLQRGVLATALAEVLNKDEEYFNAVSYKTNDKAVLDVAFRKAERLLSVHFAEVTA